MIKILILFWSFTFSAFCCVFAQNFSANNDRNYTGNVVSIDNAPITMLPSISFCEGTVTTIEVPVYVTDFNNIGALSLTMKFDSLVLIYQSFSNDSEFPGLSIDCPEPGTIIAGAFVANRSSGFSLPDSSVLFTLHFEYLGGSTELNWYDNGASCEYAGPPPALPTLNDTPQNDFYFNGSVTELLQPSDAGNISGPSGSLVCQGQTGIVFSVSPIPDSEIYVWAVPSGATIVSGLNTNSILVDFSNNAISGLVSVYGSNNCGNGNASDLYINVYEPAGPSGNISGPESVCKGQSGVILSVEPIANVTDYYWTLPENVYLISGGNTNVIIVEIGSNASNGSVTVYGTNECSSGAISPVFELSVNESPTILVQPVSPEAIIAGNGTAEFGVFATGTELSYQWQEFSNDWADISEGGVYGGTDSEVLTITNPPFSMNGLKYRCVVSGICDPSAYSDGYASLTVLLPVGISYEFEDYSEVSKEKISFTVYPNPFLNSAKIEYSLKENANVKIELRKPTGEKVISIYNQMESCGKHSHEFTSEQLTPGFYLIVLEVKIGDRLLQCARKVVHIL